jgi:serine/threonine protein phosphatase PrpC
MQAAAQDVVRSALDAGTQDNVTVVIMKLIWSK